jgi:hypothetical protein
MGLVLLRLVVSPLQPGVVGPYLVWGTWFPSRLTLEGTSHIQIYRPKPAPHDAQGTRPQQ